MKRLTLLTVSIIVINLMGVIGARTLRITGDGTSIAGTFGDIVRQNSKTVGGVWCWLDICRRQPRGISRWLGCRPIRPLSLTQSSTT